MSELWCDLCAFQLLIQRSRLGFAGGRGLLRRGVFGRISASDSERGASGPDGSGTRSVLSAMLAIYEEMRIFGMRPGPFRGLLQTRAKSGTSRENVIFDLIMRNPS